MKGEDSDEAGNERNKSSTHRAIVAQKRRFGEVNAGELYLSATFIS